MTTITTENSVYEIDEANRRIRRVAGTAAPTTSMCDVDADGWRTYVELYPHFVGSRLVVRFYGNHGMQTSPIVSVCSGDDEC